MKLSRYMRLHNLTDGQVARSIGKCRTAVLRYRHGSVVPPLHVVAAIEAVTGGKVTYEDFVGDVVAR